MDTERFKELVEQWKSMPRGTPEEQAESDEFYRLRIFPPVLREFAKKHATDKEYDLLILPVGTSFEPLALAISALRPRSVLFLNTPQTRRQLNLIVETTGLTPERYYRSEISGQGVLEIYREVRRHVERLAPGAAVAVDITAGKKSMVAGAAMAGAVLNADLYYVDSRKYLPHFRRPEPGTEFHVRLDNPYEVFGDMEGARAVKHFAAGDYAGARHILEELCARAPDPRRYELMRDLTAAYEAWDLFDFATVADHLRRLCARIEQYRLDFPRLSVCREGSLLRSQEVMLRGMHEVLEGGRQRGPDALLGDVQQLAALLFNLRANAARRQARGRFDMAALLEYRALELISQRRLYAHGLITAAPDYSQLPLSEQELLERFNALQSKIMGRRHRPYSQLPGQLSLVNGYVVLAALNDPLAENLDLRKLRGKVDMRNKSIFAHGFAVISEDQLLSFQRLVEELLERFCRIEDLDRRQWEERCRFISLDLQQ
jgi:CRISPR-associated protein (TIGR02710 family)